MRHLTGSRLAVLSVGACVFAGLLVLSASGLAQGGGSEDAQALLDQAMRHFGEGNYALAQESCKRVIAAHPEAKCYAWLVLAEICAAEGRLQEAIEEAERAREAADAEGVEMAQGAIERLRALREWFERRTAELEKKLASATEPEEIAVISLQLGDAFLAVGKTEEAAGRYRAVLDRYPERPEAARRSVGRLKFVVTRRWGIEEAAKRLEAAVAAHPGTPAEGYGSFHLAQVYESLARTPEALAHYELAAESLPEEALAATALQRGAELAARYAVELTERIIKECPRTEPAIWALQQVVGLYRSRGELAKAIWAAEAIVQKHPDAPLDYEAMEVLSGLYVEKEGTEGAIPLLEEVARKCHGHGVGLRAKEKICRMYLDLGQYEQAMSVVRAVMLLYPGAEWDTSRLAQVCQQGGWELQAGGDLPAAIRWWEKEAVLQEDAALRAEAIIRMGFTYSALREHARARETMHMILDSGEPAFERMHLLAQDYVASTYRREGKLEQALQHYEKALDLARRVGHTKAEADISAAIERVKKQMGQKTR